MFSANLLSVEGVYVGSAQVLRGKKVWFRIFSLESRSLCVERGVYRLFLDNSVFTAYFRFKPEVDHLGVKKRSCYRFDLLIAVRIRGQTSFSDNFRL